MLHDPLVGQLVSRLVWVENPGPKERLFRPAEDGGLIDIDPDFHDGCRVRVQFPCGKGG